MGGAASAVSNILDDDFARLTQMVKRSGGANVSISEVMSNLNKVQDAAGKVMDAAKGATGKEKAALDGKLQGLAQQAKDELQKVAPLVENAVKQGMPQAPQLKAGLDNALQALTQASK